MSYINNNVATSEMKTATRQAKRFLIDHIKNETGKKTQFISHKYNLWETSGIKADPHAPAAIISFSKASPMPTRDAIDRAVKALREDPEFIYPVIQKSNRVIVRLGEYAEYEGGNDA